MLDKKKYFFIKYIVVHRNEIKIQKHDKDEQYKSKKTTYL